MKHSRTGATNRAGIAGVVVAALGLLLGMAFVAPAGAQDGGDSYTTAGPSGDVAADSTVNPDGTGGTAGPSDAAADSAATAGAPGGTGTPGTSGGTPGTSGGTPGTSGGTPGASSSGVGTPGASSGPLARTGFGATLPSLLATALVAGGAMMVIAVAKRRRNATS